MSLMLFYYNGIGIINCGNKLNGLKNIKKKMDIELIKTEHLDSVIWYYFLVSDEKLVV